MLSWRGAGREGGTADHLEEAELGVLVVSRKNKVGAHQVGYWFLKSFRRVGGMGGAVVDSRPHTNWGGLWVKPGLSEAHEQGRTY